MEDNEVSKACSPANHPSGGHFFSGDAPREGEGILRALIDATGESLMLIDTEGTILLANKISAERLHSTVQDLVGTSLYSNLPPDLARSRKELLGAVAFSAASVQFVDAVEGRFYDTHAYPVYGENREVSKIAILACDITERKKSDDTIRESEKRFREFVDELPQTVSEFDTKGLHTFVNRKGFETFGSSPEDLARGVHILDVIAPEDSGKAAENLERRLKGEAFGSSEYTMVRKDGSRFPALIHTVPVLRDSKPVGFRSIVVDITEQRRAEEALKQSEERYRGIFENAVLGIFQSSPAGRLLKVNNAFASMHGYSTPDEMIAVTTDIATQHYVSYEDRLRFQDLLEEHGVVRHFEAAFYRKDGSTAHLLMNARAVKDPDGKMLYYEGTVEDVTEHRRALDAQREGEERYRTVTENSNDGIAILRGDEYIYVNGRFIELFGYDHPDDFIGKPISTAIHPDDLAMVSENNRRRQRGEKIRPRYELKGIRKDGTYLHLDVSVARTIYSGQPVSLIYLRDITERKSLEDQLRQSQKMEAIGQLAGGIAHDFNNILTALIGYGSLLQMNMDEKDRLRVYVNQILASSQKAANLTQGLLAFSRKQTIALKPCSVNAIITNVESLLRRLLTEDIDLRLNLADKTLTVMADSTQIEQVLLNLATNARDSMPSGEGPSPSGSRRLNRAESRQQSANQERSGRMRSSR